MLDRLFRRLSVSQRIVGGVTLVMLLLALPAPVAVLNGIASNNQLQQLVDIENRADRLLLSASTRMESSRVNLMRYVGNYVPSTFQALDDLDQAGQLLQDALALITDTGQRQDVSEILAAMVEYRALINRVVVAQEESRETSRTLFEAYRLGNDIGQRIELIVRESELRIAKTTEAFLAQTRRRLLWLGGGYTLLLILGFVLATLIERSVTRPVADLHHAADAFRQGNLHIMIPVVGTDELSQLAQVFNQVASQLRDLISTLEHRVQQRTLDLQRRARYLEATTRVARDATSVLDFHELISRVVDLVSESFDFYHTGLFLLDATGEWAELQAASSPGGQRMLARQHRLRVGQQGIVGYVAFRGRPRIALDVGGDAVYFDNPDLPETRSEMALPLRARDEILGVLDVQSTESGAFDEEDITILQALADQVAVAISNARLFQQAQESAEAERRALGDLEFRGWQTLLQTRGDMAFRSTPRTTAMIEDVGTLYEQLPEMQTALDTAKLTSDEASGTRLAVPIRVGNRTIGVLEGRKSQSKGAWTQDEVALLQTLIEQFNTALERARLYRETQRSAARERTIAETTERMRDPVELEQVLQVAAQEMRRALDLDTLAIQLKSPQTQTASPHSITETDTGGQTDVDVD